MIELAETVKAGRVNALFIGRAPEFAAPDFTAQYELLLGRYATIKSLAYSEQVHGDRAFEIPGDAGRLHFAGAGDALLTRAAQTALLIRTADCVPILFYSQSERLLGAVHAGWRGLEKRVLTKTLGLASAALTDLRFVVGPFIGRHSYEVGADVADRFLSTAREVKEGRKFWLNLRAVLEAEFLDLGVAGEQVSWYDTDTLVEKDWYSARRGDTRRNLSLIWLG